MFHISSPVSPAEMAGLGLDLGGLMKDDSGLKSLLEEEIKDDLDEIVKQGRISASDEASVTSQVTKPRLQNVISTMNLQTELDLKTIALKARNAEYNPKRFSAVVVRIRDPKTTALIFQSGKVVLTGNQNPTLAKTAAKKFVRIIRKVGFQEAKFSQFKVQNIQGTAAVPYKVRLESLHESHYDYSTFEPDIFAGLVYRMVKPKVVLTIFVSGKVVLTGGKTPEDIYQAFELITPVLKEFEKKENGMRK
ncbi:hypothetical protein AAMO2058_001725200 [Amorphochlora amoebiformis]